MCWGESGFRCRCEMMAWLGRQVCLGRELRAMTIIPASLDSLSSKL